MAGPLTQSHAQLSMMRDKLTGGSPEDISLAPLEHQAFAREWTQEHPLLAPASLAVAAPLYYLAKQPAMLALAQQLGLVGPNATPASLEQLQGSYSGIGQGLAATFRDLFPTQSQPEETSIATSSTGRPGT